MTYIKSCGFIAYKQTENTNLYLIIRAKNGDVGFPKGRMEAGESEIETAVRELFEETGAKVETISGFRRETEYNFPRRPDVLKQVVYFLGRCVNDDIIPAETEVETAEFLPYDIALDALTFSDTKRFLTDAECFINDGKNSENFGL